MIISCIDSPFQAALGCFFGFLAVSFGFVLGTNFFGWNFKMPEVAQLNSL